MRMLYSILAGRRPCSTTYALARRRTRISSNQTIGTYRKIFSPGGIGIPRGVEADWSVLRSGSEVLISLEVREGLDDVAAGASLGLVGLHSTAACGVGLVPISNLRAGHSSRTPWSGRSQHSQGSLAIHQ